MSAQDDTALQGAIAGLEAELPAMKARLLVASTNSFDYLDLSFGEIDHRADITRRLTNARQCETGTVNLHRDDRRAEVIFQTNFGTDVPQVQYGIAGYQFDLKAREKRQQSYAAYGGYPTAHKYEPNALGVFVAATATPDSVTFNAVNLAFGDTDLLTVKVNFQACNIGPSIVTFF